MTPENSAFTPAEQVPDWNTLEAACIVAEPQLIGTSRIALESSIGTLYLEVYAASIRLFSERQRDYDYGLLVNQPEALTVELVNTDQRSTIVSNNYVVHVEHQPFAISLADRAGQVILQSATDGHFVRRHRVPPLAKTDRGWLFSYALKSSEPVYGLGEKWSKLDKRGQLIHSFNQDALGVNAEISYKNTPFCWSPEGWGIFVHTPGLVTHAVGHASWSQRSYCCLIEDHVLDVFMFAEVAHEQDNRAAKLIANYTGLTGRAPMPPTWSGGVILSKAYYRDADEILAVAREVRKRQMPCDVITFDGRAWQDTQTRFAFEWDTSRYTNPESVIAELKALDFKICVWEYPLISVKHAWFADFAAKGWLLKDKKTGAAYQYYWDRQAFGDVLTPLPKSGIVDFTHPDAYAFWRDAHKPLFELGVDMIKADFGEQLDSDDMLAHNGESGLALHNVYAHLYNRCVFEAAERYSQSGPFLFSRAAWTGSQRFNSQWGGDPQADWEGMMGNLRGGLSWGLSGAPFYATDVGGFYKDTRDDALYVRWAQAGIFSAHFRLHGIGDREPWSYSKPAEDAVMQALRLRYRLQHYLQRTLRAATDTGLPVQRAMVLAYPQEKQAWSFENQFMFGDDLLVAPCFDAGGYVEFYLPKGDWLQFDLCTKGSPTPFQGGRVHTLQLALDEMAVFARSGVRIPLNRVVEHTDQLALDATGDVVVEEYWPKI